MSESPSYKDLLRDSEASREPSEETDWKIYNSTPWDYEHRFDRVLGEATIHSFVANRDKPVVLDLMASTAALVGLFGRLPQPEKIGIAFALGDIRKRWQKIQDTRMGIQQVTGDLALPSGWRQLESALDGRKADLIMERGAGGLRGLPPHQKYYEFAMGRIWNMLTPDNGVILMQLPPKDMLEFAGVQPEPWVESLNEHNVEARLGGDVLLLVRNPNSPAMLPAA